MASRTVLFEQRLNILRKIGGATRQRNHTKRDEQPPHRNFVTPGFGRGEGVKLPFQSTNVGPNCSFEFSA